MFISQNRTCNQVFRRSERHCIDGGNRRKVSPAIYEWLNHIKQPLSRNDTLIRLLRQQATCCSLKPPSDRVDRTRILGANNIIWGAFAILRKATISFVMCQSVCPHGTTLHPLKRYSWSFIFEYFSKSVEKSQVSLKSDKNKGYFTWRRMHIYDNILLNSS